MDPGDSPQNPGAHYYDPATLLGAYGVPSSAAAAAYAHLAQIPSAFSMLGAHHLPPGLMPPAPFGGLGALDGMVPPGLRSPTSSSLSPTTGGDWWRAASESARRAASLQCHGNQILPSNGYYGNSSELEPGEKYTLSMNGAYSSFFQLPTLTTTATSTKTSSKSIESKTSSSRKDMKSPSSTSSSSSTRDREADLRSPRNLMSPKSEKSEKSEKDKSKDEEMIIFDPLKFASAMFPYGMTPSTAAGGMYAAPPLFSFPFGTAYPPMGLYPGMIPGYPGMPTTAVTMTTTTATKTTSHTSSHTKSSTATAESSSRKKLFADEKKSSRQNSEKGQSEVLNFSTKKPDLPPVPKLTKIPVPSHLHSVSSPKSKGDDSEKTSLSGSLSDHSDFDEDEHRKRMPKLQPSIPAPAHGGSQPVPLKVPKRPASPDQVQDLSMKKKPATEAAMRSSETKTSSSARTDGHRSERRNDKHNSSKSSKSLSSAEEQFKSDLAKSERQFLEQHFSELQLAHQLAASGYSELFAAQMGNKLSPLFMHPAAMMFPPGMLDGTGLMMPPPPPSSSSRRGRTRGRTAQKSSRSNKQHSDSPTQNGPQSDLATQSQLALQHEQLRQQLEAHLRAQQYLKQEKQEKSKTGDSKLAQALMGQPPPKKLQAPEQKPQTPTPPSQTSQEHKSEDSDDLSSDSDTESTDSGSDNESMATDTDGENSSQASDCTLTPGKNSNNGSPRKKLKKIQYNENELRIPLEHGWRREVKIQSIGPRGFSGEIVYYSSCGKKMKTFNEILRYLQKNEITDLTKDNFSFSMNVNVGEFFEVKPGHKSDDTENGFNRLNEQEVIQRFLMVQQKRLAKELAKKERAWKRAEKKRQNEQMSKKMSEARTQKKLDQQELKKRRKLERQLARENARQEKVMHAVEVKRMKEQQKLMKQQDKIKKQEQLRQEKEMRAQQLIEMKQRKKQQEEQMRMLETLQKAKERELKRQQAVFMKEQVAADEMTLTSLDKVNDPHSIWRLFIAGSSGTSSEGANAFMQYGENSPSGNGALFTPPSLPQSHASLLKSSAAQEKERRRNMMVMVSLERERRRQHMLLVKALETRRKHEEKERMKEEKKEERKRELEKKLEQRRQEEEKERELRRPVEDMLLKEHKDLPELDRISGVRLPGEALADCLMVIEFLNNFKDALDMDGDTLPTLQDLQGSLLDDEDYKGEFLSLTSLLLSMAIEDPGVPNNKESWTESGQKIADIEISDDNVSEILRIFIRCRLGKEDEMCEKLRRVPLQSWNPTHRARVLAFLCNELLSNKAVTAEIEGHIETISNCRKERWIAENKIRKLNMIKIRKFKRKLLAGETVNEDSSSVVGGDNSVAGPDTSTNHKQSKRVSDDEDDDSGNDSDVTNATAHSDGEEDETLSQEELEKKIEKLQKAYDSYGTKTFSTGQKLRADDFGQDRYRRRYWVLPHCGGVFVEGLESAEPDEEKRQSQLEESESGIKCESGIKTESKSKIKTESETKMDTNDIKTELYTQTNKDSSENNKENCDILNKDRQLDLSISQVQSDSNCSQNPTSCQSESETAKNMQKQQSESRTYEQREEDMEASENVVNGELKNGCEEKPLKSEEVKSNPEIKKELQNGIHVNDDPVEVDSKLQIKKEKEEILNGAVHGDSLFRKVDQFFERSKDGLKKEELMNGIHDDKDLKALSPKDRPDTKYTDLIISLSKQVPVSESPQRGALDLKVKPETPGSFRSVESMIDRTSTPTSSGNAFLPNSFVSPISGQSAEQMLRTLSSRSQSSWFSVLPRSPCDDHSITQGPSYGSHSPQRWTNSPASFLAHMNESSQMSQISMSSRASTPFNSTIKSEYSRCDTPTAILDETLFQQKLEAKQHRYPRPILKAKRRGWWRISKSEQLKQVMESMHPRGIRERMLLRKLETTQDFAFQSCGKGNLEATTVEVTEEWEKIAASETGAVSPDDCSVIDEESVHSINIQMLKQVEGLQDRMISASLQVKGCPSLTKATEDESIQLVSEEVQNESVTTKRNVLDMAKEMLLLLESNIERRYLKPPFSKGVPVNLANMNHRASPGPDDDDDIDDDDAPPALLRWRGAVARAQNASQLCLYANQLDMCIAWEKSIMKVMCQICAKDDNEAELLLCDSCDKGYHTYCFKPRMEVIPEGDWFCFECICKATNEAVCVKCGKKTGRLVGCNKCRRHIHLDCHDPVLMRMPRRWNCLMCGLDKGKGGGRGRKKRDSQSEKGGMPSKDETPDVTPQPTPEKKHKKHEEITNKEIKGLSNDPADLTVCSLLLAEMEKHSDSWPFLKPVNTKQFPSYRKYIKTPMDFHTMHVKLRDNVYKLRSEFAADARLVFNNCQTFNEDDSEVGISGHSMRKFFEKRWKDFGGDGDMRMLKDQPS